MHLFHRRKLPRPCASIRSWPLYAYKQTLYIFVPLAIICYDTLLSKLSKKHFDISIEGTRVKLTIYFSWKRLAEGFRTNPRSSGSAHSFSRYEACKIGRWDVVIYWGSCDEEDRKGAGAAVERELVGSNTNQRALYAPSGTESSALTSPSPHNSPPQRIQGPGGFD